MNSTENNAFKYKENGQVIGYVSTAGEGRGPSFTPFHPLTNLVFFLYQNIYITLKNK